MTNVIHYLNKDWSKDFTCWDLVRTVYWREHNIALPAYPVFIANSVRAAERVARAVAQATAPGSDWLEEEFATEAGIVLLGRKGFQFHVGYLLTSSFVLHMPENAPSRAEPISRVVAGYQTVKFYTHAALRHRH